VAPKVPDYDLVRQIGRGAYGEVWMVRSVATGVWRAAKIVWRHTFEDERPFQREFEGIQRFEQISQEHPSQLGLFHIGRNDREGYFYYVMELADDVSGVSLSPRLQGGRDPIPGSASITNTPRHTFNPGTYMPYTLRADLDHGPLAPDRVLEIGLALTDALSRLHGHGLVHRDVKPSNVIFVNGRPKLADIGLVTNANDTCSIVGTEGYLPPEGPGTPQADMFALGKVLYEAITGLDRKQFPQLPRGLRSWPVQEQVLELNEVLLKACSRDASERYRTCEQMRKELALLGSGRSLKRQRILQRYAARVRKIGLTVGMLALPILGIWIAPMIPGGSTSVTVLPFANDSPDPADKYWGTSIADEISTALTKIPGLAVLGRESGKAWNKSTNSSATARAMNLTAVLSGRLRKSGTHLHVVAELVHARKGYQMWSGIYDVESSGLFGIQTDIAEHIAEKLKVQITDTIRAQLAVKPTKNLEAYQYYLEGNAVERDNVVRAKELFQQAILRDPNFAAAYAALADCYLEETGEMASGKELLPKALTNVTKALQLDGNLAAAHASLARIKCHYDYNWKGAAQEFQLAVSLSPSNMKVHEWYAAYFDMTGQHGEAVAEAKLAKKLDPFSSAPRISLAWFLFNAQKYDLALKEFEEARKLREDLGALDGMAWCYLAKGKEEDAVRMFERANRLSGLSPENNERLIQAYKRGGMREYWLEHIDQSKTRVDPSNMSPFWIACDYAMLGDHDKAFSWLEKAREDRTFYMAWVGVEFRLYSLHSDKRFKQLLADMHLNLPY
jgi:serine/threonine protein kinase/tetratricopeptide (TPR) repeat protein